jgi:hypothetical protein
MVGIMKRFRPRKEVKMWLYTDKPEEEKLVGYVTYLKRTRKLAQAIRNGLRLLWSLGEGDTSILFELFPHIEAQIVSRFTAPVPPDNGNLERKLDRIERLMLEQGRADKDAPLVAAPPLKPYSAAPPVIAPKAAPVADADAIASNFLNFIQ